MSDNKNTAPPSTLQSYVDSATGAVQSALGSLTGNTADQVGQTQNHIICDAVRCMILESFGATSKPQRRKLTARDS